MILATQSGFARVDTSPILSISPHSIFLKILLIILPLLVLGRSDTTLTSLGVAIGPIPSLITLTTPALIASSDSVLSLATTTKITIA